MDTGPRGDADREGRRFHTPKAPTSTHNPQQLGEGPGQTVTAQGARPGPHLAWDLQPQTEAAGSAAHPGSLVTAPHGVEFGACCGKTLS